MRKVALILLLCVTSSYSLSNVTVHDPLNWVQNYLSAIEARTHNVQASVANNQRLVQIKNDVQQITLLVNQVQAIEAQAKRLYGDGRSFTHLLVGPFRALDPAYRPQNTDDWLRIINQFGNVPYMSDNQGNYPGRIDWEDSPGYPGQYEAPSVDTNTIPMPFEFTNGRSATN